ncbi:MAG: 3,4-dehydroadipyl-CoA semialdehyde dehydrogenase [Gammaproteobacteria bacterium]|nr:3,4-dehydroadipyl-CoA semialdehyde dehydrogenase [Gammaproteobacteria bacterium]
MNTILESYLCDTWQAGRGPGTPLVDPVHGNELARATSDGLDLDAALAHAREVGGRALRELGYAERAALLKAVAGVLGEHRDRYRQIALENSGNTAVDAALDIDGGIGTLRYYAGLGKSLGDARCLVEPGRERLARDEAFQALHLLTPVTGVALHVNAFNFPSWGLWEKAAVALLSGVPVVAKPATATAWLAQAMVRDVVEAGVLPPGALSLVCGGGHELPGRLGGDDVVAFTGSAGTAARLRETFAARTAPPRLTVEADSLNVGLLGPDAGPDSEEFALFVAEAVREMTVKAGQKCTAMRRLLVPADSLEAVADALSGRLDDVVVGDPRDPAVTMGPLINRDQQRAAWDGIDRLRSEAEVVHGGTQAFELRGADPEKGCFVPPTLLRCAEPDSARAVHEVEVFGPVATLMPYRDADEAFALAARGGGSLVASVFSADPSFAADAAVALGPAHGRVLLVDAAVGASQTGHGVVMPQCVHGGPGRAGGGEELGGLRGLGFYHQRTAVQGDVAQLEAIEARAATLPG